MLLATVNGMDLRGDGATAWQAGTSQWVLTHGGHDRRYLMHLPPTPGGERLPLVVELHGRGIDAVQFDRMTGFRMLADREGFALAMPSALGEVWNSGIPRADADAPDDVGYLLAMIDDVCARVSVDRRRIYVTGMSNGATMAARLVCEHPERLAAVAQVAGTAGVEVAQRRRTGCPVPILQIHGAADIYAPYLGGVVRALRARLVFRHPSAQMVGVDDWARQWVEANNAVSGPELSTLPPDTTIRTWRGASSACEVIFYRIEGAGHTWPGSKVTLPRVLFGRTARTFDATRVIWSFLSGHIADAPR